VPRQAEVAVESSAKRMKSSDQLARQASIRSEYEGVLEWPSQKSGVAKVLMRLLAARRAAPSLRNGSRVEV